MRTSPLPTRLNSFPYTVHSCSGTSKSLLQSNSGGDKVPGMVQRLGHQKIIGDDPDKEKRRLIVCSTSKHDLERAIVTEEDGMDSSTDWELDPLSQRPEWLEWFRLGFMQNVVVPLLKMSTGEFQISSHPAQRANPSDVLSSRHASIARSNLRRAIGKGTRIDMTKWHHSKCILEIQAPVVGILKAKGFAA
ncbi:hypothetical protein SELMODRAFT_404221 [Selaginella moellendorffii]|uniref:Uncharacterized protein n=1 Tax=Selaginella moellendorffii TaxID=88036 RepID=D8QUN2_SELML|nr:hypothetical protein SELMODRAFT_404221 [Selaginella moellendorffii]